MPCRTLPKAIVEEIKTLLEKYANMKQDKINLKEQWGSQRCAGSSGGTIHGTRSKRESAQGQFPMTKEDKLIKCLKTLLEKNIREFNCFDL